MPVRTHTCLMLVCDVCGERYQPDDYVVHFADLTEARDLTRADGWTVTADRNVFCGTEDVAHQAALEALMPPEPVSQNIGQIGFDGSEEA
jgi:hypothetical protein